MRISDWSSDVCSSDLGDLSGYWPCHASARSPPSSPATDRPRPPPPPDRSWTTVGRASPPLAHPSRYAAQGSPPVPTAGSRRHRRPAADRKSTRLNSSHQCASPMPSSALKKKQLTTNHTHHTIIYSYHNSQ